VCYPFAICNVSKPDLHEPNANASVVEGRALDAFLIYRVTQRGCHDATTSHGGVNVSKRLERDGTKGAAQWILGIDQIGTAVNGLERLF
jgi:hypothetical protein